LRRHADIIFAAIDADADAAAIDIRHAITPYIIASLIIVYLRAMPMPPLPARCQFSLRRHASFTPLFSPFSRCFFASLRCCFRFLH